MERVAWTMQLKEGMAEEYRKRHDEIWPELAQELKEAGLSDYSIFLDDRSGLLFAVQKRSKGHTADELPQREIVQKWWTTMADLMETNDDQSPVCGPLREVFHLE